MNKKQLDSLSSTLSKAINPAARKIEATAKILEQIEPLPVVSKPIREACAATLDQPGEAEPSAGPDSCPGTGSVHVAVENCLANLTTVVKTEGLWVANLSESHPSQNDHGGRFDHPGQFDHGG